MSKQVKITNFSGGLSDDIRLPASNKWWYSENIDTIEEPLKLKRLPDNYPVNSLNYSTAWNFQKMIVVSSTAYAYGQNNNTNHYASIYSRDLSGIGSDWNLETNGTAGTNTYWEFGGDVFFAYYKEELYFWANGYVHKYNPSSDTMTSAWTASTGALYGGVIGKDDNLYGFKNGASSNSIHRVTSSGITANVLLIPQDQQIVSLLPYGNYLAIICNSFSNKQSQMFLWDMISSDVTESINIGYGSPKGAVLLDGQIYVGINSYDRKSFKISRYSSNYFSKVYVYNNRVNTAGTESQSIIVSGIKVFNNYMYFLISTVRDSSATTWKYDYMIMKAGQKDVSYPFQIVPVKTYYYASQPTTVIATNNDFIIQDQVISQYSINPSYGIITAIDTNSGTHDLQHLTANTFSSANELGIYESQMFGTDDASTEKQLKAFSIYTEALPASASIVGYYRINGTLAWTQFFTHDVDGELGKDIVSNETAATALPTYNEIQFKFTIAGKGVITGYKFKYDETNDCYGK